jgi:hypothetical protein
VTRRTIIMMGHWAFKFRPALGHSRAGCPIGQ